MICPYCSFSNLRLSRFRLKDIGPMILLSIRCAACDAIGEVTQASGGFERYLILMPDVRMIAGGDVIACLPAGSSGFRLARPTGSGS